MDEISKNISNHNRSVRQQVADAFIDKLRNRMYPFGIQVPEDILSPPINLVTGIAYTSINNVILSNTGELDPRWLTLKQVVENGYLLKDQAEGQQLVLWDKLDKSRPVMSFLTVYNARELTLLNGQDLPPFERPKPKRPSNDRVMTILANSGVEVEEVSVRGAGYNFRKDILGLPSIHDVRDSDFYSFIAKKMVQRTAKMEDKLLQTQGRPITPEQKTQKELEIFLASFMVVQELGLRYSPDLDHLILRDFRNHLKSNPDFLFQASTQAEKIRDKVFGLELEQDKQNGVVAIEAEKIKNVEPNLATERTILNVPSGDMEKAEDAGAKWDRENKYWVAEKGADLSKLVQWIPEPGQEPEAAPNIGVVEEFTQILEKAGFRVDIDNPPIMDGSVHWEYVEGGRYNIREGIYAAYAHAKTAKEEASGWGWFKNKATGVEKWWDYSGQVMSETQIGKAWEDQAAAYQATRVKAEKRAYEKWLNSVDIAPETETAQQIAYLENAEVHPFGVRQDKDGQLMVAGVDAEGRLQTIMSINQSGEISFERGCHRSGAMGLIDSNNEISGIGIHNGLRKLKEKEHNPDSSIRDSSIIIAVDYASGATLHMATGRPVVLALSADNLPQVTKFLQEKYPESNLVICADQDHSAKSFPAFGCAVDAAVDYWVNLAVPVFNDNDWKAGLISYNDLHKKYGLERVAKELAPVLAERREDREPNKGCER